MRTLLSLVVSLLAAAGLSSQSIVVHVTGEGSTQARAIANGLSQACMQVNGGQVEGAENLESEIVEKIADTGASLEAKNQSRQDIRSKTKGMIRTYDVITQRVSDGLYFVDLRVVAYKLDPNNPRSGERPTLALTEVGIRPDSPVVLKSLTPEQVRSDLGKRLEDRLRKSRVFNAISREHMDAILAEHARLEHVAMGNLEPAKIGLLLGADFLLKSRIGEFSVEIRTVELGASTMQTEVARARIDCDVVNVASGEVRTFAGQNVGWTSVELDRNRELGRRRLKATSAEDLLLDLLADEIATRIDTGFADAAWMAPKPAGAATNPATAASPALDLLVQRMEARLMQKLEAIEKRLDAIEKRLPPGK